MTASPYKMEITLDQPLDSVTEAALRDSLEAFSKDHLKMSYTAERGDEPAKVALESDHLQTLISASWIVEGFSGRE